jgi:hypothetical protein
MRRAARDFAKLRRGFSFGRWRAGGCHCSTCDGYAAPLLLLHSGIIDLDTGHVLHHLLALVSLCCKIDGTVRY